MQNKQYLDSNHLRLCLTAGLTDDCVSESRQAGVRVFGQRQAQKVRLSALSLVQRTSALEAVRTASGRMALVIF